MKVAWICQFSNAEVRSNLKLNPSYFDRMIFALRGREYRQDVDFAVWITNGINEINSMRDVELHVIMPVQHLACARQDFECGGIYYHCIRDEDSCFILRIVHYLLGWRTMQYRQNRERIRKIVEEVEPDIVHVMGAENPQYGLAVLDLPSSIPTLLQLQALLGSIVDKTTGRKKRNLKSRAVLEELLIHRADSVGTKVPEFIEFIRENISQDITIVNTTLAMGQSVDISECEKEFDFVHYAANLGASKATDVAIEAFGKAFQVYPSITLDIIGRVNPDFKEQIDRRISELDIESAIRFEGLLATHDDVITQIRKSRFALLPLMVDIVPNTLHEAMANGLPVVTSVTPGTPELNSVRETVLLSPQGDVEDIARNMCRLIEDDDLAARLRENGAILERERVGNAAIVRHWVEVYEAIIENKRDGIAMPEEFLL